MGKGTRDLGALTVPRGAIVTVAPLPLVVVQDQEETLVVQGDHRGTWDVPDGLNHQFNAASFG